MTTMQRYADRALEAHLWLWDMHHRHPTTREVVSGLLRPEDPDSFHASFRRVTDAARTWTATPDMLREIAEGVDFLWDEGVDGMALTEGMVPAENGVVIFPHGIELPQENSHRGLCERA